MVESSLIYRINLKSFMKMWENAICLVIFLKFCVKCIRGGKDICQTIRFYCYRRIYFHIHPIIDKSCFFLSFSIVKIRFSTKYFFYFRKSHQIQSCMFSLHGAKFLLHFQYVFGSFTQNKQSFYPYMNLHKKYEMRKI